MLFIFFAINVVFAIKELYDEMYSFFYIYYKILLLIFIYFRTDNYYMFYLVFLV